MSDQQKLPKLIVVMALDLDNDGQLEAVFRPQLFPPTIERPELLLVNDNN